MLASANTKIEEKSLIVLAKTVVASSLLFVDLHMDILSGGDSRCLLTAVS